MARATWLAAVLRNAGLRVVEVEGWHTRETRPGFEPVAVIFHHTATGKNWTNTNVRKLLRDGRPDLPGPLSQLGLERDGTFAVIAAGRCNHNGFGTHGNDSIGIEAYNDGRGEPWPKVQLDAFDRGAAAICRALGIPASRVIGHRESDPTRKIDPAGVDLDAVRSRIARLLASQPQPAPQEDDDMGMFIADGAGYLTRFFCPPLATTISAETKKAILATKKVPTIPFTKEEVGRLLDQVGQALD